MGSWSVFHIMGMAIHPSGDMGHESAYVSVRVHLLLNSYRLHKTSLNPKPTLNINSKQPFLPHIYNLNWGNVKVI